MVNEWGKEGAGLQRKQRKRRCSHQIKIPEYSTDQQNHMQLSSSHTSLYFQDMWSSRFWRPNISPPARCEREKIISRNPASVLLTALCIITTALVLSFFSSSPALLYISEVDYTYHYLGCRSSFVGQSNAHTTYLAYAAQAYIYL